ncbi:dihydroorotate dehydrogenase electron transfer subunit [Mumia zhuanghuii]|uniref:Dihydroorotate dehydrogenase electron transfer subunit n=2 Tax=Mumia TaxID=1546255 RepID=A0ABW1QN18_9ACTN|nr:MULTISPECIES: dihydroorotate dehydrogenase electron transfer subunit [Mumia]KAA1423255.1 dihydroorotate dehydrogenase electron transfer subunit [Mumia zhuanghuii]
MSATQSAGTVVSRTPVGDYHHLVIAAEGIAEHARPGHFVALAIGGVDSGMLLRRAFSIYRTSTTGRHGETVEIVFAAHGKGTRWMADLAPGDPIDVVGPVGRPFALPKEPVSCVLVGGGYGSAPMFSLATALRDRGCPAHLVLGAATTPRLFGLSDANKVGSSVHVTTEDGSTGTRGRVTDVLGDLVDTTDAAVVYACGPMGMLRAVADVAEDNGAWSQCAVEESMACGIGVCMTCVLPVEGEDGIVRMVRSCVDGPVFRGDRVRWDAVGTIPPGTLGGPR